MSLTPEQVEAAKALLLVRPTVLPGTRAILDRKEADAWHDTVRFTLRRLKVRGAEDRTEFCNVAGVAD